MAQNVILVEDTQTLNGGYSILLKSILSRHRHMQHSRCIFWRSPCHEWTNQGYPILTDTPTYLNKARDHSNRVIKAFDDRELRKSSDIAHSLVDSSPKSLEQVLSLSYDGIAVGQSIVSYLIRCTHNALTQDYFSADLIRSMLVSLLRGIYTIYGIAAQYSLSHVFFSESTYFSSSLIAAAISRDAVAPFFYSLDSPIVISSKHRYSHNGEYGVGPSSRSLAFEEQALGKPTIHDLLLRLRRSNTINTDDPLAVGRLNNFYNRTMPNGAIPLRVLDDFVPLLNSGLITIIIYLHALTDGAFEKGHSGFVSPAEFYISLLNVVLRVLPGANLVIRPHPNLFHMISSPFESQTSRMQQESLLYEDFISRASFIANKTPAAQLYLALPSLPARYLYLLGSAFHVSHHGTVVREASSLGYPCITSIVAPPMVISKPTVFAYTTNTDEEALSAFLSRDCATNVDLSLIPLDSRVPPDYGYNPYYTKFLRKLRNWDRGHNCFDNYVYRSGLSWSNPSDLAFPREVKDALRSMSNYSITCLDIYG